jgi:RNA polymerase subunit RPABC4/transcription elongation factor Spt4
MDTINCAKCGRSLTPQRAGEACPNCGSLDRNITAQDLVVLRDKANTARELARRHYGIEEGLTSVFRYSSGSAKVEASPAEPIKFLEVNAATIPTSVMPLQFGPVPASGIHFPSVIIEVTPDEYRQIQAKELQLPAEWDLSEELPKPEDD